MRERDVCLGRNLRRLDGFFQRPQMPFVESEIDQRGDDVVAAAFAALHDGETRTPLERVGVVLECHRGDGFGALRSSQKCPRPFAARLPSPALAPAGSAAR